MTITHHGRTFEVRTPEDIAAFLERAYEGCLADKTTYCDRCEVEILDDGHDLCAKCQQDVEDAHEQRTLDYYANRYNFCDGPDEE
jgi:hypothetical protein